MVVTNILLTFVLRIKKGIIMTNVEKVISAIRDSFIGSQQVYTEGSCYHFYLILKSIFPEAEAWYNSYHVITKIGDKFYDITGEVNMESEAYKMELPPCYALKAPYNIYKNINK